MNIDNLIGNTPIIKIKVKYKEKVVNVYAKLEYYNYTGSIKDRLANYIINTSKKEGILKESKKNLEVIHFVNDTENEFLNITEEKTEKQIVEEIVFEQESFSVIGLIIFEGVDTSVKKIRSERISDIYAINIKKEWSDGIQEHEDDEVILTLYEADHNKSNWKEKRDVILNSENKWSIFVENLDKNKDYSIGETKVMSENLEKTDAYQSEISVSVSAPKAGTKPRHIAKANSVHNNLLKYDHFHLRHIPFVSTSFDYRYFLRIYHLFLYFSLMTPNHLSLKEQNYNYLLYQFLWVL